jgi:hypothetical protein
VKYIIVGDLERGYYDAKGITRLQEMAQQGSLRVAFNPKTQNPTIIYEVVESYSVNEHLNTTPAQLVFLSGMPPWVSVFFAFLLTGIASVIFFIFIQSYKKRSTDHPVLIPAESEQLYGYIEGTRNQPNLQNTGISKPTSQKSVSLNHMKTAWIHVFADFNDWVEQITSFEFPKLSRRSMVGVFTSILMPVFALGLAYFGQTFLDLEKTEGLHLPVQWFTSLTESQRLGIGSGIFIIAAILWVFSTIHKKNDPPRFQSQVENSSVQLPPQSNAVNYLQRSKKIFLMVGLFCSLGSILLYILLGENSLVRWLWGIGLGLFLLSLFIKSKSASGVLKEASPAFQWYHILALMGLLVVAFCLRVYRLYDIPLDLSTDMAAFGISARDYLLGIQQNIFGTSSWFYAMGVSYFPYVLSMAWVQNNLYGFNFGTAVLGTLNILGVYLFTWRLLDKHRLAFLTAVILTINPAHIHYSRIPVFMDPWFFGFFALYFLLDGLKDRRRFSLALSGLLTGFTLVAYSSGKAIIPMIAIFLICAWLFKRKWVTDNFLNFIWMGLGIMVALGPNLAFIITDWPDYIRRAQEVLIFNQGNLAHHLNKYGTDSTWMVVWEQIKRSALTFNYYIDRSAQFAYPYAMFNSMVSPMLILGLGMGFYRWRKPEFLFLVASFGFILVTGGILTNDAPTWCRLVGIIPLAALLIALTIDKFLNLFEKTSLKPFVPILFFGVALYLGAMGVMDWNDYINNVSLQPRPVVNVGRYLDTLPWQINACGITQGFPLDQEEIKFLAWPRQIVSIPPDTATLTTDTCPGPKLVWILSASYRNRLPEIQSVWAEGTVQDHLFENGEIMFTSYLVSGK